MNRVQQIAKWSEADGYELTPFHAHLYEEQPAIAAKLEECMIRALKHFRAHPYRRIDIVAGAMRWVQHYVTTLCVLGVFPARKQLDMCRDGQQRWWWYIDIYEAVAFRSLPDRERCRIVKAIRAGRVDNE